MLGDGLPNSGTQGSYFKYQYGVLKLLEQIAAAVAIIGPDNETRTTRYEAIAPGVGYVAGQFLIRYDIIDTTTSTIISTIWFNQDLQTTLVGAGNPNPVDIVPVSSSLSVTVLNPFNLEVTQLANNLLLTSIDVDTAAMVVDLAAIEVEQLNQGITLDSLLADSNAMVVDLAAIEGLLTLIEADTGNILTDTNAMVVDLAAIEVEQLNQGITLDSILADTDSLDTKLLQQVFDFGTSATAIKVAAVLGNEIDPADFGIGAPSLQTLRVVIADPDTTTPQAIGSVVAAAGAGSVAAGATSVGFTTDSLFAGSINGPLAIRNSSTFYGFEAAPGKTLPAIPYIVGAGTMTIDTIV